MFSCSSDVSAAVQPPNSTAAANKNVPNCLSIGVKDILVETSIFVINLAVKFGQFLNLNKPKKCK
ncbi:hypothetical protein D770_25265 [Flammeovirgaceae bacterium 311]|nr:hypothetical protein D770_25265 [Flammeovirgaceae bacterium 311]